MTDMTLGEQADCKHCGKTITVGDGGYMGYYWFHVEHGYVPCNPIVGVWAKPRAQPKGEDDD